MLGREAGPAADGGGVRAQAEGHAGSRGVRERAGPDPAGPEGQAGLQLRLQCHVTVLHGSSHELNERHSCAPCSPELVLYVLSANGNVDGVAIDRKQKNVVF